MVKVNIAASSLKVVFIKCMGSWLQDIYKESCTSCYEFICFHGNNVSLVSQVLKRLVPSRLEWNKLLKPLPKIDRFVPVVQMDIMALGVDELERLSENEKEIEARKCLLLHYANHKVGNAL